MPELGLRKPHVSFAGCSLLGSISGTRRRAWKAVTEKGYVPSCLLAVSENTGPRDGMSPHWPQLLPASTAHPTLPLRGSCSSAVPCSQASQFWPLRLHLFPEQPLSDAPSSDIGAQIQGAPPLVSRLFPVFLQLKGTLLPLIINPMLPQSSL